MHKPILINDLGLSFPQKSCFANFNAKIRFGNRIAIIGNNGSGKSTLLKILQGKQEPSHGEIIIPADVIFGYVPQVIEDFNSLSGGERLQKSLTKALALEPNVLILDEPTNHLDRLSRKSLMRMLQGYAGTLIIVSHDAELLRHCINILWHINKGEIHSFSGNYDDYLAEFELHRTSIEQELAKTSRQKKEMHQSLMKEQQRAVTSRAKGEKSIAKRKWPTIVSKTKVLRSQETSGKKKARIEGKKQDLIDKLSSLQSGEKIIPKFSLSNE
ncbi:MAG: transporter ATP-binding protein, partial [Pseudomonadota bacterium]|nr:transporter ATP-binding protein [Pseudomonadota bacterium]